MDAKKARAEYEKFVDACIDKGVCPGCDRPLGISIDRPTGRVMTTCRGCGWTRIKGGS